MRVMNLFGLQLVMLPPILSVLFRQFRADFGSVQFHYRFARFVITYFVPDEVEVINFAADVIWMD